MKIRTKLILIFLLLSLVPSLCLLFLFYNNMKEILQKQELNKVKEEIHLKVHGIDMFLKSAHSDILFLRGLSYLRSLLNAGSEQDREWAKQGLENDFLIFSREKKIYYQIRYIDENG